MVYETTTYPLISYYIYPQTNRIIIENINECEGFVSTTVIKPYNKIRKILFSRFPLLNPHEKFETKFKVVKVEHSYCFGLKTNMLSC